MENIIELEVVNKNVEVKYRKSTNIFEGNVCRLNFSKNWNEFKKRIIFLVDNDRISEDDRQREVVSYSERDVTIPTSIFDEKNKNLDLYIGVFGEKDKFYYPSIYCYLGKIQINN